MSIFNASKKWLFISILGVILFFGNVFGGEGTDGINIRPIYGQILLEFDAADDIIDSSSSSRAMLVYIRDFKMDGRGNFYLLDSKHPGILLFDGKGYFTRQIGKFGKGPGDYTKPSRLYIDFRDHIFIYDQGNYNVTGLDPELKVRFFARIRSLINSDIFVDSNGFIYAFVRDLEATGPVRQLALFNEKGERVKTIAGFRDSGFLVKKGKGGAVIGGMLHEYSPDGYLYSLDKDSFIYGYNLENKIFLHNAKKLKSTPITLAAKKSLITAKEKEYFEKKCGKWAMLPVHRPFFNKLLSDEKGRVYVSLVNPVLSEEKSIKMDVFTKSGEYIYRMTSPAIPLLIRDGCLYALGKDESGNPIIKRFRIKNYASLKY